MPIQLIARSLAAAALLGALVVTFPGCDSERPLWKVKSDGEFAMNDANYQSAIADFSEYCDRKPGDNSVRLLLGEAYLKAGEPVKAREQLTTAYDTDPACEPCADGLAQAYYDAKEYERLTLFLRRLASERQRESDYLRLGIYSAKLGNADEALQALMTAATMDKGQTVEPQLALAEFYRTVKDKNGEVLRLRMAAYIAPGNVEIIVRAKELGEVVGPSFPLRPAERPADDKN
jgi:tetratricopeptide (TPR) repeat protein